MTTDSGTFGGPVSPAVATAMNRSLENRILRRTICDMNGHRWERLGDGTRWCSMCTRWEAL